MRRLLEYAEFIDREDLKEKMIKIKDTLEAKEIIENGWSAFGKKDYYEFPKWKIKEFIERGYLSIFSSILPLEEQDEKRLYRIAKECVNISTVNDDFDVWFHDFFLEVIPNYKDEDHLKRPVNWESLE